MALLKINDTEIVGKLIIYKKDKDRIMELLKCNSYFNPLDRYGPFGKFGGFKKTLGIYDLDDDGKIGVEVVVDE